MIRSLDPFLAVLEQQKILWNSTEIRTSITKIFFHIETQRGGEKNKDCIAAEKKAPSSHANPICEQQSTRQITRMRRARICQTCSSEPLSALEERMNIQGKTGRHPLRQWWEFITKQLTPNEWYSFILIRCFVVPFFSVGVRITVFFNPARLLIYRGCWIGLCPCAEKKMLWPMKLPDLVDWFLFILGDNLEWINS